MTARERQLWCDGTPERAARLARQCEGVSVCTRLSLWGQPLPRMNRAELGR